MHGGWGQKGRSGVHMFRSLLSEPVWFLVLLPSLCRKLSSCLFSPFISFSSNRPCLPLQRRVPPFVPPDICEDACRHCRILSFRLLSCFTYKLNLVCSSIVILILYLLANGSHKVNTFLHFISIHQFISLPRSLPPYLLQTRYSNLGRFGSSRVSVYTRPAEDKWRTLLPSGSVSPSIVL